MVRDRMDSLRLRCSVPPGQRVVIRCLRSGNPAKSLCGDATPALSWGGTTDNNGRPGGRARSMRRFFESAGFPGAVLRRGRELDGWQAQRHRNARFHFFALAL